MKKLAIVGKADKRIFAYPLLKCLALMGKTAVITDDAAYSRLYSEDSLKASVETTTKQKKGHIHENIEIVICPDLRAEYPELMCEYESAGYDTVLILSDCFMPQDCDHYMIMTSIYKDFVGRHLDEYLNYNDDKDIDVVILTTTPQNKKEWELQHVTPFTWTESRLFYIYKTEEVRKLSPLADKEINNYLCGRFASALGLTPKEFFKIAKRKL